MNTKGFSFPHISLFPPSTKQYVVIYKAACRISISKHPKTQTKASTHYAWAYLKGRYSCSLEADAVSQKSNKCLILVFLEGVVNMKNTKGQQYVGEDSSCICIYMYNTHILSVKIQLVCICVLLKSERLLLEVSKKNPFQITKCTTIVGR